MLSAEQLRSLKPGQSISLAALLPKVTPERLKIVLVAIEEQEQFDLRLTFKKTYFGAYMGDAVAYVPLTGEVKWEL